MMGSETQASLLARLQDGTDPLVWEEFFSRYWRLIHRFARQRGCAEHTAEEVVQEVMLTVFQQRDVFRYDPARGRFRDWLLTVVRNKVAEHRRRPAEQIRAQGGETPWDLLQAPAGDDLPDEVLEAAFEEAVLLTLLDTVRQEVTPRTYQAFELFTLHELPAAEVARITGITRNAVYQARKNIMRRLEQLGASFRDEDHADLRIRSALRSAPSEAVERSVTTRTQQTMRRRLSGR
ncbi:MAG: sigma-70 family RNA polymerase sigma factor [Thermoguttaceae bacterium]